MRGLGKGWVGVMCNNLKGLGRVGGGLGLEGWVEMVRQDGVGKGLGWGYVQYMGWGRVEGGLGRVRVGGLGRVRLRGLGRMGLG